MNLVEETQRGTVGMAFTHARKTACHALAVDSDGVEPRRIRVGSRRIIRGDTRSGRSSTRVTASDTRARLGEAIVRRDGTVDIQRIVRSLGFGLDENAIQALKQWRFEPGKLNGRAVAARILVEVDFSLK